MTDNPDPKTPAEALAAALARRKAEAAGGGRNYPGARQSERAASARANAQSKPASRK
jgi:hypothetical protein